MFMFGLLFTIARVNALEFQLGFERFVLQLEDACGIIDMYGRNRATDNRKAVI
jgi:hypothetical protein